MIDRENKLGSVSSFQDLEQDNGTKIFFLLRYLFESLHSCESEAFDGNDASTLTETIGK